MPPPTPSTRSAPGAQGDPSFSQAHLSAERLEAVQVRRRRAQQLLEGKPKTRATYEAALRDYEWFCKERKLPMEAFPITADKVTLFMDQELERPHKSSDGKSTIPGTKLGRSAISNIISGLEHFRLEMADLWPAGNETRLSLRSNASIKVIEDTVKKGTAGRTETAQALKAIGGTSTGLTRDEIADCATWAFEEGVTRNRTAQLIRDRAMFLGAASLAFRGDSIRTLEWSDMFVREEVLPGRGEQQRLKLLAVRSDNSKVNAEGRVDEFGMARARDVRRCAVSALAFHSLFVFQLLDKVVPDFAPKFGDDKYGQWGRRDWWGLKMFPAEGDHEAMSYSTHRRRFRKMFDANGIMSDKVTHALRPAAAQIARTNGASADEMKAQGGWRTEGSYRACYDRTIPLGAVVALAGFDGRSLESYFVSRSQVDPPQELQKRLFPWVEQELASLQTRYTSNSMTADFALRDFLHTLIWFRTIILQDAAFLINETSAAWLWANEPIFSDPAFTAFAASIMAESANLDNIAEKQLGEMPEKLAGGVKAMMKEQVAESARQHNELLEVIHRQSEAISQLQGMMRVFMPSTTQTTLSSSTSTLSIQQTQSGAICEYHTTT
ncbi:hypothetical protein A4X13_0g8335 [Tilletia indica]|uniref:Ndc10 domain-containing protein n=1 Tax=Tilletia indica TaxID=43049 RepID=A0A177TU79_9BASI|nr:hypothetical protein A4X13_0g8335 [Tilletia indica]